MRRWELEIDKAASGPRSVYDVVREIEFFLDCCPDATEVEVEEKAAQSGYCVVWKD